METDIIIVEPEEIIDSEINAEDIEQIIEQQETVEYVEVEDVEEIEVDIEESIGWVGGDPSKHYSLSGRGEPDQHPIEAITGLYEQLHDLSTAHDQHSIHSGFAEFQQWAKNGTYKTDPDYKNTGGVGYFVSLVTEKGSTEGGNIRIDICKKVNNDNTVDIADVYGVTVINSGFYGNQDERYDLLNPRSINRASNPDYAKVCLLGNVEVRVSEEEYLKINIGDYVVPNELGYAKKSENNVGFKVISHGQKESVGTSTTAWYYVNIALVPQNDNVARVMAELEKTNVALGDVNLQLGEMSGSIGKMEGITIGVSDDVKNFKDILGQVQVNVEEQLVIAKDLERQAKEVAEKADTAIQTAASQYVDAVNRSKEAIEKVESALSNISELDKELEPLASWKGDNGQESIAGFVAQADKNSARIGTMTKVFGDDASYLTAILQKIDENGAAIQHLVTHVDKYILGSRSPIYVPELELSLDQMSFMQPGTIYVPTEDHEEVYKYKDGDEEKQFSFEFVFQEKDDEGNTLGRGKSYIWATTENKPYKYMWQEYKPVSLSTEEITGESDGDLWYCWNGSMVGDKLLRESGVLYRWTITSTVLTDENTGQNYYKHLWTQVASVDDGNAASIGSVTQTAKDYQIAYTNLQGDMATLEVEADRISSSVTNIEGDLTEVYQTAENIMMGVYGDGSSSNSLSLLLDGTSTTAIKGNVIKIKGVEQAPDLYNAIRYKNEPTWDGSKFIPVGEEDAEGEYYFDVKDGKPVTSYYCKITDVGYDVYGVNNMCLANIHTRVSNTESEVESWTMFQKGQNETGTSIKQTSDEKGSSISSVVYGDFRKCVEIKDGDSGDFSDVWYIKQPAWNNEEFTFKDFAVTDKYDNEPEAYCLSKTSTKAYYKLFLENGEVSSYEKYEMESSPYAAVVQKVENGKSTVGLMSKDDSEMGSILVNTVNDKSTVTINADKIGIYGTTTFQDILNPGTTTISGDYIRSGVLVSNNYNGPVVYKKYGLRIKNKDSDVYTTSTVDDELNLLFADTELNIIKAYKDNVNGVVFEFDKTAQYDFVFIGMTKCIGVDLGIEDGKYYYYNDNGEKRYFTVESSLTKDGSDSEVKLVKGKLSGGFYFALIEQGITYKLLSSNTGQTYYWCDAIELDRLLTEFAKTEWTADKSGYVVSSEYFDLEPSGEIDGTKFDLNEGTIYSKNLILNRDGNLSITGDITATGGKIGGFTIEDNYLYNGQTSLYKNPSNSLVYGQSGVFISPEGIGLGNGKFYVEKDGTITMNGNISLGEKSAIYFGDIEIDEDGNVISGNTFIQGQTIYSPNIDGGTFTTKKFYTYTNENGDYEELWSKIVINGDGIIQYGPSGNQRGFFVTPIERVKLSNSILDRGKFGLCCNVDDEPFTLLEFAESYVGGSAYINFRHPKMNKNVVAPDDPHNVGQLYIGTSVNSSVGYAVIASGYWDFQFSEVHGLTATFG